MTTCNNTSKGYKHFDLPTVACRAAIEVEKIIRNQSVEPVYIKQLTEWLSNDLNLIDKSLQSTTQTLVNPMTITVMSGALSNIGTSENSVKTVTELVEQALKIKNELEAAAGQQKLPLDNNDELVNLRMFCIALSKAAIAQEEAFNEWDANYSML